MEFLFITFQAYKLQPSALHVLKISENSYDNMFWGIPFYSSRCVQVLCKIAALNSFLKSSKVYLKGIQPGCFTGKFSKIFPVAIFSETLMDCCFWKFKHPFVWNTNGQLWMDESEIVEKWIIVWKRYWCRITKQNKEYWGVSDKDLFFFSKKTVKEK